MSEYDTQRFVDAHEYGCFLPDSDYRTALAEIRAGRKRSHWIWYIFPQLQGLGRSDLCREYGVQGLDEARELMKDEVFASHLREISQALLDLDTRDPVLVLGKIDARKVRSCMTLFALASGGERIFLDVLREFYGGAPDERTLELLGVAWPW
ncbi:MAG: DUF1810 domain-containing protein [Atopobiaceae bacterium]|nr:DUF1810 domain-containing protein [Atopobiaceae bacterium]